MDIRDKAILITGGSRGLGRALGKALALEGGRVVLAARGRDELNAAVDEIRAAGGDAYGLAADVGDKNAIHAICGQAAALVGAIDVLIHNASTLGPVPLRLLLDTDCEDLQRVLEVNLLGPFRLSKAIAGAMVLRGSGMIMNITSDASVEAYEGWGAYSISKAALDHMTRVFAVELRDTGVQFLAVDPGEMDTRMHADAMPQADTSVLRKPDEVALRIVAILHRADQIANGSRLSGEEVQR